MKGTWIPPARSISQTPPNRNSHPSPSHPPSTQQTGTTRSLQRVRSGAGISRLWRLKRMWGEGINADQFSEHVLERALERVRGVEGSSEGKKSVQYTRSNMPEVYTSIFGTKGVETTPTPDFIEALLDGKAQLDQELNDPPEDPLTTQTSHQMLYETIMQIHKNLDSPLIAKTAKTGPRRSLHRRRVAEQAVSSVAWAGSDGETGTETVMEAIGIKKIRRKKMNKHKWKKRRRLVRDSSRYNKEKRKKSGPLREKQE
ncbi:hypothetical protein BC829DRAFT_409075 [Chytridium lagenaria]|nr:hypothetical protein BC829DRAFT_409075 [Chytridium lagenaria]